MSTSATEVALLMSMMAPDPKGRWPFAGSQHPFMFTAGGPLRQRRIDQYVISVAESLSQMVYYLSLKL